MGRVLHLRQKEAILLLSLLPWDTGSCLNDFCNAEVPEHEVYFDQFWVKILVYTDARRLNLLPWDRFLI